MYVTFLQGGLKGVLLLRNYTRKTNKLRNVNIIGRRGRNISTKKWNIDHFKIKNIPLNNIGFGSIYVIRYGQVQIFSIKEIRLI